MDYLNKFTRKKQTVFSGLCLLKKRKSLKVLFYLLLVFPAYPLLLSSESPDTVLERSLFKESEKETIINEFKAAQAEGIPEEFLLPRLEEGIVKNSDYIQVFNVLKREKDALKRAREILLLSGFSENPLEADWKRTSNMLLSGITDSELLHLTQFFSNRQAAYRQGTTLYLALIRWGIYKEKALKLVEAASDSEIHHDSYTGIIDILTSGRRERIRIEDMIIRLLKGLAYSGTIEQLKQTVLY